MPRVIPVGPLLPSPLFSKAIDKTETNKEGDESLMRFLDKHRPQTVVFKAFGSVVLQNTDKLIEEAVLRSGGQWAAVSVGRGHCESLQRHVSRTESSSRFMVDVAKVAVEFRDEVERVGRLVMQEEAWKLLRSNLEYLKQSALTNAGSLENLTTSLAFCGSQCNPAPQYCRILILLVVSKVLQTYPQFTYTKWVFIVIALSTHYLSKKCDSLVS